MLILVLYYLFMNKPKITDYIIIALLIAIMILLIFIFVSCNQISPIFK